MIKKEIEHSKVTMKKSLFFVQVWEIIGKMKKKRYLRRFKIGHTMIIRKIDFPLNRI